MAVPRLECPAARRTGDHRDGRLRRGRVSGHPAQRARTNGRI